MPVIADPVPGNIALTLTAAPGSIISITTGGGYFDAAYFDPAYFDTGGAGDFGGNSLTLSITPNPGGMALTEE